MWAPDAIRPMPSNRMRHPDLGDRINGVTGDIIDAAVTVHRSLGPGFKEAHYKQALGIELRARGHDLATEVARSLRYRGEVLRGPYVLDLLVDDCVIVEAKVAAALDQTHEAQLLSYLRAFEKRVGLLINFGGPHMGGQIRRLAL